MASSASNSQNGPVTSPTLLNRLKVWDDRTAWNNFIRQYDPLFQKWGRDKLRNAADVQDLNQQVSLEVAERLVSFDYDSNRSFRGWLKTLYFSRLLDFLKAERRRQNRDQQMTQLRRPCFQADHPATIDSWPATPDQVCSTDCKASAVSDQHARAQQIQSCVRDRVSEKTWSIFWEIAVQGNSIADTAKRYSMKYASTFAAYSRVHKMLQHEASLEISK